jgi:hypothetical protein
MKFPSYVPEPAAKFLTVLIEGNGSGSIGYAHYLEESLRQGVFVDTQIREARHQCQNCGCEVDDPDTKDYVTSLEAEKLDHTRAAEVFSDQISLLRRLGYDELMRETFTILGGEFVADHQWGEFLLASITAQRDYSAYRTLGKEVTRLSQDIEATAKQLARQVRDLRKTGVWLPPELMPAPTEDTWESFSSSEPEISHLKILRLLEFSREKVKKSGRTTQDVVPVLLNMAERAAQLRPNYMSPGIHAALQTRQNSKKSAYIRSFGALLVEAKIELTSGVKRSMAITANVVLDDPNVDVSEDDVRKALQIGEKVDSKFCR